MKQFFVSYDIRIVVELTPQLVRLVCVCPLSPSQRLLKHDE